MKRNLKESYHRLFLRGGGSADRSLEKTSWVIKLRQIKKFKSGQIYMKDAESAEKSNFQFLFSELWSFLYLNHPNFR